MNTNEDLSVHTPDRKPSSHLASTILIALIVGALAGGAAGLSVIWTAITRPEWVTALEPLREALEKKETASVPSAKVTLEENSNVINVVEDTSPAVVSVVGKFQQQSFFFDRILESEAQGTGFIIDMKEGIILTNRHVVESAGEYQIITSEGVEIDVDSTHIFKDPFLDLAVIKVDMPSGINVAEIQLGDSDAIVPGQQVIAIGNALGTYDNTVTTGVVSALGRQISASGGFGTQEEQLLDMIQTDAAINPGNSGGPLLNSLGQVIGINSAIDGTAENIGFAIPINAVKGAVESYLLNGEIIRPWLGISFVTITAQNAAVNDLPVEEGAYVGQVITEGPAAKAGLLEGDIITEIDGVKLTAEKNVIQIVQQYQVNEVVDLTIMRPKDASAVGDEYDIKTLTVVLEARV